MTVQCPVHGIAASTAYSKLRCRCQVCRDRAAVIRKASRARTRTVRLSTPRRTQAELEKLFEDFDRAIRVDVEILIQIAEDSAIAREASCPG